MVYRRLNAGFWLTTLLLSVVLLLELALSAFLGDGLPLPLWYSVACLTAIGLFSTLLVLGWATVRGLFPDDTRIVRSIFFYATLLLLLGRVYGVGDFLGYLPYVLVFLSVLAAFTAHTYRSRATGELGLVLLTGITLLVSSHFFRQVWLYTHELSWADPPLYAFGLLVILAGGGFGYITATIESRAMMTKDSFKTVLVPLLVCWGAILGVWYGTQHEPQWAFTADYEARLPEVDQPNGGGSESLPNVFLITLDTMRVDELFASKHQTRFDQLRKDGISFNNLASTSSWTLPAHASLFTGKLPYRAGAVRTNTQLFPDVPSYVQFLNQAGYRTGAFTDGVYTHKNFGFGRGFDTYWHQTKKDYREYVPGTVEWTSYLLSPWGLDLNHSARLDDLREPNRNYVKNTIRRSKQWIEQNQSSEEPFFLFMHTYQAHDYWMRFPETYRLFRENHPELAKVVQHRKVRSLTDMHKISKPLLDAYEILYRYEMVRTVKRLESFLEYLRRENLYEDSLILLLSDHGEAFSFDPLVVGHDKGQLHEVLIKTPAVLKLPGNRYPNKTLPNHLSFRDLFPIVMEQLGLRIHQNGERSDLHDLEKLLRNPDVERDVTKGSVLYKQKEGRYRPKLFVRSRNHLFIKNPVDGTEKFFGLQSKQPFQRPIPRERLPDSTKKLLEDSMRDFHQATRQAPDPYNRDTRSTSGRRQMLKGLGYF